MVSNKVDRPYFSHYCLSVIFWRLCALQHTKYTNTLMSARHKVQTTCNILMNPRCWDTEKKRISYFNWWLLAAFSEPREVNERQSMCLPVFQLFVMAYIPRKHLVWRRSLINQHSSYFSTLREGKFLNERKFPVMYDWLSSRVRLSVPAAVASLAQYQ